MARSIVLFFVAVIAWSSADVSERKVEVNLYPDCKDYKICLTNRDQNASLPGASFPNVVYVRSAAGNDILHYVMTTVNVPSVLMVHTTGSGDATLKFDWDRLLNESAKNVLAEAISLSGGGSVQYSHALVYSRLIEYDDVDDQASLTHADWKKNTQWNNQKFTDFHWKNLTMGPSEGSVIFNTTFPQPPAFKNHSQGSLYFQFEVNKNNGRDADLPRLMFNANNTQVDFVLDGYIPKFNKSRFALEMTVVANYSKTPMEVKETKSIDDEYSPGVFRILNWYTRGDSADTGYVQWKPICYLKSKRSRSAGTEVSHYDLQNPSDVQGLPALLGQSVVEAFYGDNSALSMMASNVSFGLSGDGFYLKNNFTAWTASVGYGQAPSEAISTLVLVIIAAGLGIPVVIIVFGGLYVCIRKKRSSGYDSIDGDDVTNSYPRVN